MPLFSAYTAFGLFEFSSDESPAESIHKALDTAMGGGAAFDIKAGSDVEADNYATAMAIAAARSSLRRAGLNMYGATATEKLPQLEAAYGVVPSRTATIAERRAVLAAKYLASRGSREEAIDNALRAALGTDFVFLYVIPRASVTKWPSTYGATPGLFSRIDIPAKTVKLLDPVAPDFSVSGVVTVPYENWVTAHNEELLAVSDRLVIEPENPGGAELVTVTAVAGSGSTRTFTATFTKPHEQNCAATTRPTPFGLSTRRHYIVILKTAAAVDNEKRRIANAVMRAAVRGVSTWSVVHESTDGSGAFVSLRLDTDKLDTNLLVSFTR